jgi:hypothetical protein
LHFASISSSISDVTNGLNAALRCDGCGQMASPEHIARRLQRLEWTTRYRPIHIGALLLAATAPVKDSDFLYAPSGEFTGEAALVLETAGLETRGKSRDIVLTEFQRSGFFLAHVLECPLVDADLDPAEIRGFLERRVPSVFARIRRSLKPKRLVPISRLVEPMLQRIKPQDLGCVIVGS